MFCMKIVSTEPLQRSEPTYFFHQVLRDGRWTEEEAAILVPGDIVSIKLGDIIPADARLLEGDPLKIDQVLCIVITFLNHLAFDDP